MKIKNTSNGDINLASGVVKPGDSGEATSREFKFLVGIKRCEVYVEPPEKKKPAKKSVASGGLGGK